MIISLLKPLFASKTRIKILSVFFETPGVSFFVREMTRKTGEQINAVRRELENLEQANLVSSYSQSGKKYYQLNQDYFFYDELFSLFNKASLPALAVAEKLYELGEHISLLLLTGRLVGISDERAPLDMFIVGDILKEQVSKFIQEKMDTEIEIRFAVVSEQEFLERVKMKDRVLKNLLTIPENVIPINILRKKMEGLVSM